MGEDLSEGAGDEITSHGYRNLEAPRWTVIVSTFNRSRLLPGLLDCFEAQADPPGSFEVVIADNGSTDETWSVLEELTDGSPLPVLCVRASTNRGPGAGRNLAVERARGTWLAFTDDDCLPASQWLAALDAASRSDADILRGPVQAAPLAGRPGLWDRTLSIGGGGPLFETANIAYRKEAFLSVGGFDESTTCTAGGRAFGEDVLLGDRVVHNGGRQAFVAGALVHHRWLPGSYREFLEGKRMMSGFPKLVRHSETLRRSMPLGVFLTSATARFDLALLGATTTLASRRMPPMVMCIPWAVRLWPEVRARSGGSPLRAGLLYGGHFTGDAAGLLALIAGSVRERRVVL